MIFLTVGTEFPFDRLVRAVDKLAGDSVFTEEIIAQIGNCQYRPRNISWVSTMEKRVYDKRIQDCNAVIGHAGMGTIIGCLELNKPLLVTPRLKMLREHVNDHQVATARKFESLGYILVAYNTLDLPLRVKELYEFSPPVLQERSNMIADCIRKFLESLDND